MLFDVEINQTLTGYVKIEACSASAALVAAETKYVTNGEELPDMDDYDEPSFRIVSLKEKRVLHADDLRNLCINKNWYTLGYSEDYINFLKTAESIENITTADIVALAQNIKANSDTEYEVSNICFEIGRLCHNFFE